MTRRVVGIQDTSRDGVNRLGYLVAHRKDVSYSGLCGEPPFMGLGCLTLKK
jgi:hypothetical protein